MGAFATPMTPCDHPDTSQDSAKLLAQIERTEGKKGLLRLASKAQKQLEQVTAPGDLACVAYAAGSAYFFLSTSFIL